MCIIVIFFLLLVPFIFSTGTIGEPETFDGILKRKYEYVSNGETTFRLEVQTKNRIRVLNNIFAYKKESPATLQANLSEGTKYRFTIVGYESPNINVFPNVISAIALGDVSAEIKPSDY